MLIYRKDKPIFAPTNTNDMKNLRDLESKKITLATFKRFINSHRDDLYMLFESSFNGMSDMVEYDNEAKFKKASHNDDDRKTSHSLGIDGLWLVNHGSRDYFTFFEDDKFIGIQVHNACGSSTVAVLKEQDPRKKAMQEVEESKEEFKDAEFHEMAAIVNRVVVQYSNWDGIVKEEIKKGKFEDVDGMDWNEYYHDTQHWIQKQYDELVIKYNERQFEVQGFSTIDW